MAWARWTVALAVLALGLGPAAARCAEWPQKSVTFVVPFPPGGSTDPLARLLGRKLGEALGQSFIVENHPGASGAIGAALAARAPADGYTFLFVFDTHAVNPALQPDLPFDTQRDLAPVMLLGTAPMLIVTQPAKPYQSLADVIRAARAAPGSVSFGSAGSGSIGHLAMMLLQDAAGFELTHVPYKGGGPMIQDALGGHIELGVGTVSTLAPHLRAGALRPLAITAAQRSPRLPQVPTLAEEGYGVASALGWWAVFAPAGTPEPILARLHGELARALAQPDVRTALADDLGIQIAASSPTELSEFLAREMARWGTVVREHQISGD